MGFAVNGLIMILLHLGPNFLGMGLSIYDERHPGKIKAFVQQYVPHNHHHAKVKHR